MLSILRILPGLSGRLLMGLWALYLVGAFYFDMNLGMPAGATAALFFVGVVTIFVGFRGRRRVFLLVSLCALATAAWLGIQPSHDREWIPLKAVLPYAEFNGDLVTIHNVRDFNFTGVAEFEPAYLDRTIDLSKIIGLDMYVNWWGVGDLIAHPMLSWRFENAKPITISIENRESKADVYSLFGGFYKQYELIYIVSTDRDAVMKRSKHDRDNEIYLYKLSTSPEEARALLVDYLETVNSIYNEPRWYNTILNNCTTNIRVHEVASAEFPLPWDVGILFPGLYPLGIYNAGGMASDLPFAALESRGYLNLLANEVGYVDDFWMKIRQGVPGFEGFADTHALN